MSLNQHWTKKEVSEPPERSRRAVLLFTELHTRYSKDPLAGHEPNPHIWNYKRGFTKKRCVL